MKARPHRASRQAGENRDHVPAPSCLSFSFPASLETCPSPGLRARSRKLLRQLRREYFARNHVYCSCFPLHDESVEIGLQPQPGHGLTETEMTCAEKETLV